MKRTLKLWHLAAATIIGLPATAPAAGPGASCHLVEFQPIQLREQEVHVTLQTGFARTEVTQTLFNPNAAPVEAILHVPLSEGAALAEIEVGDGTETLRGEVLAGPDETEAAGGGEAGFGFPNAGGFASRIENGDVEIRIARLRPQTETQVRWVAYTPQALDRGEGRFIYPPSSRALPGRELWTPQTELQGTFRMTVDLRYPSTISRVAAPGFDGAVQITRKGEDELRVTMEAESGEMDGAATLVWNVEEPEGGGVELIAHRPEPHAPGSFMMVFTPSVDFLTEAERGFTPVLHFPGGRVFETSALEVGSLERGRQHVVFGRYNEGGRNRVVLREGGAPESVRHDTVAFFPAKDSETPELERLWAQDRIEWIRSMAERGAYDRDAAERETARLGAEVQILTRSNVMALLDDEAFKERGVVRRNARRVAEERKAQALRAGLPVWKTRVDLADAFFSPKGRKEGGCCITDVSAESVMAFGIDLNARPNADRMAAQGLRYW